MPSTAMKPLEGHKTSTKRVNFEDVSEDYFSHNFIRGQLRLSTWLALGAATQALLFALPIPRYYAATPVIAYLLWEVIEGLLIIVGVRNDPQMAKSLKGKYTALIPDEDGEFRMGSKGSKVAVLHLALRNHHHLGMFAPGFRQITERSTKMFHDLEVHADKYGLLGMSSYTSTGNTKTSGELMNIMYFKSNEDVLNFASSPIHREAWEWYNRVIKDYPHLGIMHELFEAEPGKWEAVYENIEPNMLAASKHKIIDQDGTEQWISPVVDANKGPAAAHKGRIA